MTELTCIICPMGCGIQVELNNGNFHVSGQGCPRGEIYAKEETLSPKRMLTGVVALAGRSTMLPVKTAGSIPKSLLVCAMEELRGMTVHAPVRIGDVIKKDVAGSGVDLIATKNID